MTDLLNTLSGGQLAGDAESAGYKCGSEVIAKCDDLQIPWGEDWAFQMILGDLIDAAQTLIKFAVQYMGPDTSENLLKGVNSLRCSVTNIGANAWNLIASAYWAMVGAGQQKLAVEWLDIGYEFVCTCQEDAKLLMKDMDLGTLNKKLDYFLTSCTEVGRVKQDEANNEQKERVKAKIREQMAKVRAAKRIRKEREKEEELKQMVLTSGKRGLEKEALRTYKAFKALQDKYADEIELTDGQQYDLDAAEDEYGAVKVARDRLIGREVVTDIKNAKRAGGIIKVQTVADLAMDALNASQKKREQFPTDEGVMLDVKAAETRVEQFNRWVDMLANAADTSEAEKEEVGGVQKHSKEKAAYLKLAAEARGLDADEQAALWPSVEKTYRTAEAEFNYGKTTKAKNLDQLQKALGERLMEYDASLSLKNDIDQDKKAGSLLPDVPLSEDDIDEIETTIKKFLAEKGGEAGIQQNLISDYDLVVKAEQRLKTDESDVDLQKGLVKAREIFDYARKYAKDNERLQNGYDPKKAAAAAVGDGSGSKTVALDPSESKGLEAEVAAARAAENKKYEDKIAADKAKAAAPAQGASADGDEAKPTTTPTVVANADGTTTTTQSDGTVIVTGAADGSTVQTNTNGTSLKTNSDGTTELTNKDGTVDKKNADGTDWVEPKTAIEVLIDNARDEYNDANAKFKAAPAGTDQATIDQLESNKKYYYSRYSTLKDANVKGEQDLEKSNPEIAKAKRDDDARKKKDAERKNALPEDVLIKTLKNLDTARKDPADPAGAETKYLTELKTGLDNALQKAKDAAKDASLTQKEKVAIGDIAEEAQKVYVEVQKEVKKENDKKEVLVNQAKAAAEAKQEAKTVYKIPPAEKLEIVKEFKSRVSFKAEEIKEKKLTKLKKEKPLQVAKAGDDEATKAKISIANKKIQLDNEKIVKENKTIVTANAEAKTYNDENAAQNAINKTANKDARKRAKELGKEYYTTLRKEAKAAKKARKTIRKEKGKNSKSFKDAQLAVAKANTRLKVVAELMKKSGKAAKKAQDKKDKVKYTVPLATSEAKILTTKVDNFVNFKTPFVDPPKTTVKTKDAQGVETETPETDEAYKVRKAGLKAEHDKLDKQTGLDMLKTLEENMEFDVTITKKAAEKDRTPENLAAYYEAETKLSEGRKMVKDKFKNIGNGLTPAEEAEKTRKKNADKQKTVDAVDESMKEAKTPQEIGQAVIDATSKNSVVGQLLFNTKPSTAMSEVLDHVHSDKGLSQFLSNALLKAKNGDDISAAFASTGVEYIKKAFAGDEVKIQEAKVKGVVTKSVIGAGIEMQKIKDELATFVKTKKKVLTADGQQSKITNADGTTTDETRDVRPEEVLGKLEWAQGEANKVLESTLTKIGKSIDEYNLNDDTIYNDAAIELETIFAKGRAEAKFESAAYMGHLTADALNRQLQKDVEAPGISIEQVQGILAGVKSHTSQVETEMKNFLDEALKEVETTPSLASEYETMKEYRDTIASDLRTGLDKAEISADLYSAGATAYAQVANTLSSLQVTYDGAIDPEQVTRAAGDAEDTSAQLQKDMAEELDKIVAKLGIDTSDQDRTISVAETLAEHVKEEVKKAITTIADEAVKRGDGAKARIKKEEADFVAKQHDSVVEQQAAAEATIDENNEMLAFYRGEVSASQDETAKTEMNAEITKLTKQIKVDKAKVVNFKAKATNLEVATTAQQDSLTAANDISTARNEMQDYVKELTGIFDTNKKEYEGYEGNFQTLEDKMYDAEYEAENAETEALQTQWVAEYDRLQGEWDEQHHKMDDNKFFMDDAEAQLKELKESFEIGSAQREADKSNADLSVAYASNEVVKITKQQVTEEIAANNTLKAGADADTIARLDKANAALVKDKERLAAEQAAFEDEVDSDGKVTKKGKITLLFEQSEEMNAKASNIQGKMDRLRAEAEVAEAKAKEEGIAGIETALQAELQELQMDWDLAEEGGTERENIQKAIDAKKKDIQDIEDEKKAGEEERIQIEAQAKETKEMEELLDQVSAAAKKGVASELTTLKATVAATALDASQRFNVENLAYTEARGKADQLSTDLEYQRNKLAGVSKQRDIDSANKKIGEITTELKTAQAKSEKLSTKVSFLQKKKDNAKAAAESIKKALAPKKTAAEIFEEAQAKKIARKAEKKAQAANVKTIAQKRAEAKEKLAKKKADETAAAALAKQNEESGSLQDVASQSKIIYDDLQAGIDSLTELLADKDNSFGALREQQQAELASYNAEIEAAKKDWEDADKALKAYYVDQAAVKAAEEQRKFNAKKAAEAKALEARLKEEARLKAKADADALAEQEAAKQAEASSGTAVKDLQAKVDSWTTQLKGEKDVKKKAKIAKKLAGIKGELAKAKKKLAAKKAKKDALEATKKAAEKALADAEKKAKAEAEKLAAQQAGGLKGWKAELATIGPKIDAELAKFAEMGFNEETGLIKKAFEGFADKIEVEPEEADYVAIDAIYEVLDKLYNRQDELGQKVDGVVAKQAAAKAQKDKQKKLREQAAKDLAKAAKDAAAALKEAADKKKRDEAKAKREAEAKAKAEEEQKASNEVEFLQQIVDAATDPAQRAAILKEITSYKVRSRLNKLEAQLMQRENKEREELDTAIAKAEKNQNEAKTKMNALIDQKYAAIDDLQAKYDESRNKITGLVNRQDSLSTEAEFKKNHEEIEKLDKLVDKQRLEVEKATGEMQAQQKQARDMPLKMEEEGLIQQNVYFSKTLKAKATEITGYKTKLAAATKDSEDFLVFTEVVKVLEQRKREMDGHAAEIDASLREVRERIKTEKKEFEMYDAIGAAWAKVESFEAQYQKVDEKKAGTDKRMQNFQKNPEKNAKKIKELEREYQNYEKQYNTVSENQKNAQKFAEQLQANMNKYLNDKSFQEEIKWKKRELADVTKFVNDNKKKLEKLVEEAKTVTDQATIDFYADAQMDADADATYLASRQTELTAEVTNLEERYAAMLAERAYQEEQEKAEAEKQKLAEEEQAKQEELELLQFQLEDASTILTPEQIAAINKAKAAAEKELAKKKREKERKEQMIADQQKGAQQKRDEAEAAAGKQAMEEAYKQAKRDSEEFAEQKKNLEGHLTYLDQMELTAEGQDLIDLKAERVWVQADLDEVKILYNDAQGVLTKANDSKNAALDKAKQVKIMQELHAEEEKARKELLADQLAWEVKQEALENATDPEAKKKFEAEIKALEEKEKKKAKALADKAAAFGKVQEAHAKEQENRRLKQEAIDKQAALDAARNDKVGLEMRLAEMEWLRDPQSAIEFPDWPGLYGSLDALEKEEFDAERQLIKDTIFEVEAQDEQAMRELAEGEAIQRAAAADVLRLAGISRQQEEDQMQAALAFALTYKEQVEGEMNDLKDDLEFEETVLAETKSTMSKEEKEAAETRIFDLKQQITVKREDVNYAENDWFWKNEETQVMLANKRYQEGIVQVKQDMENAQAKADAAKDALNKANATLKTLNDSLKKIKAKKVRGDVEAKIDALDKEIKKLKATSADENAKFNKFALVKKGMDDEKAANDELQAKKQRFLNLESQMNDYQFNIDDLTGQLDQIDEQLKTNADASLQTLRTQVNTKLDSVYDKKKKIQKEFDQLTKEKKDYEKAAKAEAFADAEKLALTRKNEIKTAEARLAKAQKANDTAAIAAQTTLLADLKQKFDEENQVYAGLKEQDALEQVSLLTEQLASLEKDINKAKSAANWATTQMTDMEAKMKAMNAGDKKDFDQKKYDGYKETYYKNKSVKDSNDAFVKEQQNKTATVNKTMLAQRKLQEGAASVRAEADEKKSNEEKRRALAKFQELEGRYTTQKAKWDVLEAAEKDGSMTQAQWQEKEQMREAYEKISEEYTQENSTYMAIEKEAAEKEYRKAEDLYYRLKRTVDESTNMVTRLKENKKSQETMRSTQKTQIATTQTRMNEITSAGAIDWDALSKQQGLWDTANGKFADAEVRIADIAVEIADAELAIAEANKQYDGAKQNYEALKKAWKTRLQDEITARINKATDTAAAAAAALVTLNGEKTHNDELLADNATPASDKEYYRQRNQEIPGEIEEINRQLTVANNELDLLNQQEADKKEADKRKDDELARTKAKEARANALSVAWAATKGPALEITEANAQIKTLQDENKTVGDQTKIKENYTKINGLRDKVSKLTKTYNALKKTAEDMKKANDMAQADEDKQVEQQAAADARNKETNAEFQRVAAAYAAAAKAVDENNAKITKYEKQVFAHAEIQADVVAGTNEKYKDLAAWTKQDTKLKKFVSLYKGKVTKLAEAMQTQTNAKQVSDAAKVEAETIKKAMNAKAAKEVEYAQAKSQLNDLKALEATYAAQRADMVKKNQQASDIADLDKKIAANATKLATAQTKYNTLYDAKVKIEEAEREKLLIKQKNDELAAAKAQQKWLQAKVVLFDEEKKRLTTLLASGKDEEGKPQTAATTAKIAANKALFEKVVTGTKQIILDVTGERAAQDQKTKDEAKAKAEKDEKAALTEKMAKAELYKDKVATLETTIADLTAKLGKASVPAVRENFEKDLKKANADKKKYEGIMQAADKEFAAKKKEDDAKVLKENEENDKQMNALLGAENTAKLAWEAAVTAESTTKEAYELETDTAKRATKKAAWVAAAGAIAGKKETYDTEKAKVDPFRTVYDAREAKKNEAAKLETEKGKVAEQEKKAKAKEDALKTLKDNLNTKRGTMSAPEIAAEDKKIAEADRLAKIERRNAQRQEDEQKAAAEDLAARAAFDKEQEEINEVMKERQEFEKRLKDLNENLEFYDKMMAAAGENQDVADNIDKKSILVMEEYDRQKKQFDSLLDRENNIKFEAFKRETEQFETDKARAKVNYDRAVKEVEEFTAYRTTLNTKYETDKAVYDGLKKTFDDLAQTQGYKDAAGAVTTKATDVSDKEALYVYAEAAVQADALYADIKSDYEAWKGAYNNYIAAAKEKEALAKVLTKRTALDTAASTADTVAAKAAATAAVAANKTSDLLALVAPAKKKLTDLFATNTSKYDAIKALFLTADGALGDVKTKSDIVGQKDGDLDVWKISNAWDAKKALEVAGKKTLDEIPNSVLWKEADDRLKELVNVKKAASDLQVKMAADAVKKEQGRQAQILVEEKLKKQEADKAVVLQRKKETQETQKSIRTLKDDLKDLGTKYHEQQKLLEKATDQNAYVTANAIIIQLETDYGNKQAEITAKEALLTKLGDDKKAWDAAVAKKAGEEEVAKEAARVAKLSSDVTDAKAAFKIYSDVKDAEATALEAWKEAGQKWHLKKADDAKFKTDADALILAKGGEVTAVQTKIDAGSTQALIDEKAERVKEKTALETRKAGIDAAIAASQAEIDKIVGEKLRTFNAKRKAYDAAKSEFARKADYYDQTKAKITEMEALVTAENGKKAKKAKDDKDKLDADYLKAEQAFTNGENDWNTLQEQFFNAEQQWMNRRTASYPSANEDGTAIAGMLEDGTWDDSFIPAADTALTFTGGDGFGLGPAGTGGFGGATGGFGGSSKKPIVIPDPSKEEVATTVTANAWDTDATYKAYKALKKQIDEQGPIWTKKQNDFFALSTRKADADNEAWEKEERDKRIAADAKAVKDVAEAKKTYEAAKGVWDALKLAKQAIVDDGSASGPDKAAAKAIIDGDNNGPGGDKSDNEKATWTAADAAWTKAQADDKKRLEDQEKARWEAFDLKQAAFEAAETAWQDADGRLADAEQALREDPKNGALASARDALKKPLADAEAAFKNAKDLMDKLQKQQDEDDAKMLKKLKADSAAKSKENKTALKTEDKKRTDAITEKATWEKEKTRLEGVVAGLSAGGAKTAAEAALLAHTGAASGDGFAKGKAIDAKVTASKAAYKALMTVVDEGEEALRRIELEQEKKAGDKLFNAAKKTFENAKKEVERKKKDLEKLAEQKNTAETNAAWTALETDYQKVNGEKTVADAAFETARNLLNTYDIAKRARDKTLSALDKAAKDKQDSKTREGEITAANTAIGELDTKIAKYEPSGAWDIAAATASAFPNGSKKTGNCKNFNSAATPANTWTYHRKTSGVADEAACKKRCDDFKTDESANGLKSNHAGRAAEDQPEAKDVDCLAYQWTATGTVCDVWWAGEANNLDGDGVTADTPFCMIRGDDKIMLAHKQTVDKASLVAKKAEKKDKEQKNKQADQLRINAEAVEAAARVKAAETEKAAKVLAQTANTDKLAEKTRLRDEAAKDKANAKSNADWQTAADIVAALDAEIVTLTTEKDAFVTDLETLDAEFEESTRRKEESDAAKKTNDETNAPEVDAVIVAEVVVEAPSATGDDLATFTPISGSGSAAAGSSGSGNGPASSQ